MRLVSVTSCESVGLPSSARWRPPSSMTVSGWMKPHLDVLVEECVICEIKAVEKSNPVYTAQLLSQLRLTGVRLGFLINFNVPLIKYGIKRVVI